MLRMAVTSELVVTSHALHGFYEKKEKKMYIKGKSWRNY